MQTRPRSTIRRLVAAGILVALSLAMPKPARAGRLGADIIALFPKEIGEFAYADLKKARSLKWFSQLQEQMIPDRFRQFEKFLASAGVDPNSQVDELAWGLVAEGLSTKTEGTGSTDVPTGEEIVGVALGTYNPNSTEAFFKQQKLATFKARGYTLYALQGQGRPAVVVGGSEGALAARGDRLGQQGRRAAAGHVRLRHVHGAVGQTPDTAGRRRGDAG